MHRDAAAAILAGGRARRLGGCDKSRLVVHGRPIINRQIEVLQQVAGTVFIVAPEAQRFADLGLPVVPDDRPGLGVLGGIQTAVRVSSAPCVLVVGCDLPFLHAGLLARLVEVSAGHDAAWVRTERGPEPLLACYRKTAAASIEGQMDAGRLRAADLGAVLRIAELDTAELMRFGPPDRLLANVNTPADYERLG